MSHARASLIAVALASCVPELPRPRSWVGKEVVGRTGAQLRVAGDREFAVPAGVRLDDGLSAAEAVAVAIWNNPAYQADLGGLGLARADLADAGVLPNPIATLLIPVGPKQLELTVKQGLGGLWHRPARLAVARAEARRVAETLVQHGLDLARDAELAHARVVLAERTRELAREAAAIWSELAAIAEARRRSGDASQVEANAVRADARVARDAVEQAETELAVARNALRAVLGAPESFSVELAPFAIVAPGDVAQWTAAAHEARPDLRAARFAIEAAGARADLARRRIVDFLAVLDLNGSPLQVGPGIELPLPVFDRAQGARIRARAELERASWAYVGLRLQIAREIADAHARLVRASSMLVAWRDDILPARVEAQQLAGEAFALGEESHLVVLEATRARIEARRRLAEAEAEQARATAELVRAAGGRYAR